MKKRIISLLLCAAMLLTLTPMALAEEAATEPAPESLLLEEKVPSVSEADEVETITAAPDEAEANDEEHLISHGDAVTASPQGEAFAPLSLAALDSSPEGGAMEALTEADAAEPSLGATTGTCGPSLTWTLEDGVLTISGEGAMADYTSGGAPWYSIRRDIAQVVLGDGVASIGNYAFYNCTNLGTVSYGAAVAFIGRYAFSGCSALGTLTLPDSVITVGEYAFENCTSLGTVTIGNGLTNIPTYTFIGCTKLATVTIGSGVRTIGSYAFSKCTSLTNVTIGENVTSIGAYAFSDRYDNYNVGDILIYHPSSYGCSKLTSIVIPDSVTTIGEGAFAGSGLMNVTIGNGVTSIGKGAFNKCANLLSVQLGSNLTQIGDGAFANCTKLSAVTVPDNVTGIGRSAFYGCSTLRSVTLGESVTKLDTYAFSGCSVLKTVAMNKWVSTIESNAFQNCSALSDVYYLGTAEDWGYTTVKSGNTYLTGATFHFTDSSETPVTGISLNKSALRMTVGTTATLTATVTPADAANQTVIWTTSDGTVASVLGGVVIANSAGTATITAATADGGKSAACTVTVTEVPAPAEGTPTLTVVGGTVRPGKTVTVKLNLANNTGLAGVRLNLSYPAALTLTSVTAGEALSELTFTQPGNLAANPVSLLWDGMDADATNGTILNLTFTVADGTADGEYPITVTYQSEEVFDGDMENVALVVENGTVSVKTSIPGDANSDGDVNGKDVTILRQFLAGGYGVTIDTFAADVNRDGAANGKDVTMLRQYLAGGYGVTLE